METLKQEGEGRGILIIKFFFSFFSHCYYYILATMHMAFFHDFKRLGKDHWENILLAKCKGRN